MAFQVIDAPIIRTTPPVYYKAGFIPSVIAGLNGEDGTDGTDGTIGLNAYETWLLIPGNEGKTIAQWDLDQQGDPGAPGVLPAVSSLPENIAPSDADAVFIEKNGVQYKWTWAGIKANLKTYFDALYTGTTQHLYVSMTGNDANPGTSALPFRTIQKAADVVVPGDTVIVRDGVYTNIVPNYGSETIVVRLTRSGTAEAPIIFKSENLWGAVIDGSNFVTTHGFMLDHANYIEVNGFTVKDMNVWGMPVLVCDNVKFNYNHVYNIGNIYVTDVLDTNGRSGYLINSTSNVVVNGNLIHNIGRHIASPTYPDALGYQYKDHGIYLDNVTHATVSNCVITECNRGWAIHSYSSRVIDAPTAITFGTTDLKILHNTIYTKNQQSRGVIILSTPLTGFDIANNILMLSETADLLNGVVQSENTAVHGLSEFFAYMTEGTIRNNITHNGATTIAPVIAGAVVSDNIIDTDPLITSLAAYNFNLLNGSPCVDAGVDVSVTTDYAGSTRITLDLGAYATVFIP